MVSLLVKEASDEALHLRKLLQKYKADTKNENLTKEDSLSHIENMIRVSSSVYAKLEFVRKI